MNPHVARLLPVDEKALLRAGEALPAAPRLPGMHSLEGKWQMDMVALMVYRYRLGKASRK